MRILLITTFFYPQNRIPVLRVGQWAKYWAKQGHDVTVLTTLKHSFLGPFGLEPTLHENIEVVEVPFVPEWLKKRLEGRKASGAAVQGASSADGLRQKVRKLRGHIGSLVDVHDLWIGPARRKGLELMAKAPYDAIVSSFSPPAVHMVAGHLKTRHPSTLWLADFRDLWADNHITSAQGLLRHLERLLESRTIRGKADALATVSEPLAEHLRQRYPHHPVWVTENGFDPEEFPDWQQRLKPAPSAGGMLRICYAGTLYPGRRDPTPLLLAINRLIDTGVLTRDRVAIDFYGQNEKELTRILQRCKGNRHGIVHAHGFVSRADSLAAQARSSLLLLLESREPAARGVLTGKLFEYLVSGIPILAVGIDTDNAAGALLHATGTGVSLVNEDDIADVLEQSIRSGRFDFYQPKIDQIAAYSRDAQAHTLINRLVNLRKSSSC